jgi:hypothetical protein
VLAEARLFCKQIGGVRIPYCPLEIRHALISKLLIGGVNVAMPGDGSVIWTLVGILAIVALVIFIL